MRPLDFPNNIQIQTTSFCNASCGFCPYPETSRSLPMGTMDDDLFHTIVDQLPGAGRGAVAAVPDERPPDGQANRAAARVHEGQGAGGASQHHDQRGTDAPRARSGMARLDLDSIHVSSNGLTPETYRATMGLDGSEVLANVNHLADALRAAGARTRLIITALLLRQNREEIFLARDYWRARGVEFFLNPLERSRRQPRRRALRRHVAVRRRPESASTAALRHVGLPLALCVPRDPLQRRSRDLLHGLEADARPRQRARTQPGRSVARPRLHVDSRAQRHGPTGERALCRHCGENRFSIDQDSLDDLVARAGTSDGEPAPHAARIAQSLRAVQAAEPDTFKLNLLRPRPEGRNPGEKRHDECSASRHPHRSGPRAGASARAAREHAICVDLTAGHRDQHPQGRPRPARHSVRRALRQPAVRRANRTRDVRRARRAGERRTVCRRLAVRPAPVRQSPGPRRL